MPFVKHSWVNRVVQHAGRRKLTNVSTGDEMTVDVTRDEGTITETGDAFSAGKMNDLENRIDTAITDVEDSISDNMCDFLSSSNSSAVSVAASTAKNVLDFTLEPGYWTVTAWTRFPSNSTGVRQIILSTTGSDTMGTSAGVRVVTVPAYASQGCVMTTDNFVVTEDTHVYVRVWHNAGAALNTVSIAHAMRVGGVG